MGPPVPPNIDRPAFAPLVALLRDTLIKPSDLIRRWGQSADHLSSCRRRGVGIPFIRLPGVKPGKGSIRYRLSDVIAAELQGMSGPLSLERVCLVVAGLTELSEVQRAAVVSALRRAFG